MLKKKFLDLILTFDIQLLLVTEVLMDYYYDTSVPALLRSQRPMCKGKQFIHIILHTIYKQSDCAPLHHDYNTRCNSKYFFLFISCELYFLDMTLY